MATVIIDLDGTICSEEKTYSRSLATINVNARDAIESLREMGYKIIIYTARTWMEYEMTVNWLKVNGVKYDQLIMGKPIGDYWIDDRAIKYEGCWQNILEKVRK